MTSTMLRWATILGLVGFGCGFIGPMVLAPDANQGPMLGIFITGPGGVVLGAVLGLMVAALGVAPATASRLLYFIAIFLAAATLYFCIPQPRHYADVVDGEIRQCTLLEQLKGKTVNRLNQATAAHPPLAKPVSWGEAFDLAFGKEPGVIIDLHVYRTSILVEHQARWNHGTLEARPWRGAGQSQRYFANYAGADCGAYAIGARSLFRATGHVGIWPPAFIAEMLALKVATPLSPPEAALLGNVGQQ